MERSAIHLLRKRGESIRAIAAELGHGKTTIVRALSERVDQQHVPLLATEPLP